MKLRWQSARTQFIGMLGLASLVSIGFFAYGALRNHGFGYGYLIWNLVLAWLPLIFAAWLIKYLRTHRWSSWPAVGISLLWLLFLPNSFYMISDFIHLNEVMRIDILYDAIMFSSFIFTGVTLGITSLYLVQRELEKRLVRREVVWWIGGTLLVSSFAVYLGRDLRWNSWDVLTNPGGLLFDVSDRLLHPANYPGMFVTVLSFFALLCTIYGLAWRSITLLRQSR